MEARLLHRVVSSLFETESHSLINDEGGNPIYTAESWNRISRALDTLELPYDDCPYDYPVLSSGSYLFGVNHDHLDVWCNNLTYCKLPFVYAHVILALSFQDNCHLSVVMPIDNDVYKLRYLLYNYADFSSYCTLRAMQAIRSWIEFYYGMKSDNGFFKMSVTHAINDVHSNIYRRVGFDNVVMLEHGGIYFLQGENEDKVRLSIMEFGFPVEMYKVSGIFFGQKKYIISDHGVVRTKGFAIK